MRTAQCTNHKDRISNANTQNRHWKFSFNLLFCLAINDYKKCILSRKIQFLESNKMVIINNKYISWLQVTVYIYNLMHWKCEYIHLHTPQVYHSTVMPAIIHKILSLKFAQKWIRRQESNETKLQFLFNRLIYHHSYSDTEPSTGQTPFMMLNQQHNSSEGYCKTLYNNPLQSRHQCKMITTAAFLQQTWKSGIWGQMQQKCI